MSRLLDRPTWAGLGIALALGVPFGVAVVLGWWWLYGPAAGVWLAIVWWLLHGWAHQRRLERRLIRLGFANPPEWVHGMVLAGAGTEVCGAVKDLGIPPGYHCPVEVSCIRYKGHYPLTDHQAGFGPFPRRWRDD